MDAEQVGCRWGPSPGHCGSRARSWVSDSLWLEGGGEQSGRQRERM